MYNYSLIFYPKKTKNNPNLSTIYARITVNGERAEISTGHNLETKTWLSKAHKVSGSNSLAKSINCNLNKIQLKMLQTFTDLQLSGKVISAKNLVNKFLGRDEENITIIQVFKDHNKQMEKLIGKTFAEGTWQRYETSLRHTVAFLEWKYNVSDISVREINAAFVANYEFWLRTVRNCENNTTVKYIKNFQKIVNICLANEWMLKDPFKNYKTKLIPVTPHFLTMEQIETVSCKVFKSGRLSTVRDIFIFSCFTGLAYVDAKNLSSEDISVGIDGNKWIKIKRTKTKVEARIPLLPMAEGLIKKYEKHPKCINAGRVLPILSNQKMNEYLKEISTLCDIDFDLSFHVARHTFATTITLNNGVALETVSKMLGHKSIKMTQHYAKVLDTKIMQDMQLLREKLDKHNVKSIANL